MLWCFGSAALLMTLLSLVMLVIQPRHLLHGFHPARLLRGCLALICLALALGLFAVALLIPR